jgi:oligopeptide/dipeptide ABC transporter ATP-binding protein
MSVASAVDAAADTATLVVRGLSVEYAGGRGRALDGLDLTLRTGRTVGLIGTSGSGKTTAARAILNLLPADATVTGSVMLDGTNLRSLSERARRKIRWERLALVPQAAMNALDPVMRIDRQIAEVVRAHRHLDRRTALSMAHEALESVGIHRDRSSAYPHQFSGGMRQRVSIAMATVLEPQVLIADEPTTGLDVVVQDRILELLAEAKERFNLSLVVVTHDLGVANELCDEMVVLEKGRVTAVGAPLDVLARPRDRHRPGGDHPSRADAHRTSGDNPALETIGLTIRYRSGRGLGALRHASGLTALDQVSLDVAKGEIVGLAGESGCGKSSLVSTLVGLNEVNGGVVRIGGAQVADSSGNDWAPLRRRVQMIFQDPYDSLNPRLTVRQTVAEPLFAQRLASGEEARDRVCSALENAGLSPVEDYLDRLPHHLSGGERQRVAIARALVVEPEVILADEPVSMLDEHTSDGVVSVLVDLAHRLDVAILLVTHDVSLLRRVCDRVAIMYLGRIVELGHTDDVLDHPEHPYTEALVRAVPSRVPGVHRPRVLLPGEAPSLRSRPDGCAFHPRCIRATEKCHTDTPVLTIGAVGGEPPQHTHDHGFACWHPTTPHAATEKGTTPE